MLSIGLLAWQTIAGARFPLHRRQTPTAFAPRILVLKPLKGCDEHTAECLRSWLRQDYRGRLTFRFGVANGADPVCEVVRGLLREFPQVDAGLLITGESLGANAKISNLVQLYQGVAAVADAETLVCISDADVRVPGDLLAQMVIPMENRETGLVTSLYQLANPSTTAMEIEAIAVNADFWSQVLQSNMLKAQDFALGAVMLTRCALVEAMGGLRSLVDFLADDYQLGKRIVALGRRIVLSSVIVECWDAPASLAQVWGHQLRWSRTIRVSQPWPYFFSILNNVSLWITAFTLCAASLGIYRVAKGYPWHVDLLWITNCALVWICAIVARFASARYLVQRLTRRVMPWRHLSMVVAKDFVQAAVWAAAFVGNEVVWRGRRFKVKKDGRLEGV